MKINQLQLTSHRSPKRVGRGISAGRGKTAGRGTKGQGARTGKKLKPGFEGGQTKLSMRLPKARGFKHQAEVNFQIINLSDLIGLKSSQLNPAGLVAAGKIKHANRPVKLLGNGSVDSPIKLTVQAASQSAIKAIESAGGKLTVSPPSVTTDAKPTDKDADKVIASDTPTAKPKSK